MKIGLILIATGKYIDFVDPLVESVREHFFQAEDVNIFLFTDQPSKVKDVELNVIKIEGEKWPYPTLHRYKYINDNKEAFKDMEFLYYSDVDMKFVAQVGYETITDGIVAVLHPGFYGGGGSWETNNKSTAYTKTRGKYYAGGFNGGSKDAFLEMAKELSENIQTDDDNNIIAVWHDESHLNCYLSEREVKELTPSHCYPETWDLNFKKRILALDKDHKEVRA